VPLQSIVDRRLQRSVRVVVFAESQSIGDPKVQRIFDLISAIYPNSPVGRQDPLLHLK
jgi:hypothetical protein